MASTLDLSSPLSVNGEQFALQQLSDDDLDAVLAIEQRSHAHPWSRRSLKDSLASHYCVGLVHQGNILGYAVLSFVVGEAELLLFVLDTPWHGRGIAKAFLQRLLEVTRVRARCLFLEVRLSNDTAVGLYESLGFNQVGLRPSYYPSPNGRREDALLYAMELI